MADIRNPRWTAAAVLAAGIALAWPAQAQRGGRPPPVPVLAPRPPAELQTLAPPDAVIVHSGSTDARLQAVRVRSVQSLEGLRQRPQLALERDRVDLRPLLASPQALPNVATRLRAVPAAATVLGEESRVYEIDQGLVVRSLLTYRLKPGACSEPGRRAQVQAAGIRCLDRRSPQAAVAAFSDPKDPRFIADPARRAQRIQQAQATAKATRARIDAGIATLRAQLADPAGRAALAAQIGAAEVDRLAKLDAAALEAEVANTHEARIEQVVFVPREGRLDARRFPRAASLGGLAAAKAAPPPPKEVGADYTLDPVIYLTGFTLGRNYEWRERVETSISWCFVGCTETYYAEVYAGFGYGFGLRFPIRFDADYHYRRVGDAPGEAKLVPRFQPINGSAADYAGTGLRPEHVFDGKELVAQLDAWAGFGYKIPLFGSNDVGDKLTLDFTESLPGDFKDGQFDPPAPGETGPSMEKVFETFDVLGGSANFGIVGAQVFPAVRLGLTSSGLDFTLRDNVAQTPVKPTSGQELPLKVSNGQAANFTVESPVYNLAFEVTPGLQARLFIDVELWSYDWRPTLWFPELAIKLPPGGMDFACHEDTTCSRHWNLTQKGAVVSSGADKRAGYLLELDNWAARFDVEWLPQCADETCRIAMKFLRLGTVLDAQHQIEATPSTPWDPNAPRFKDAARIAPELVHDSQVRLTKKAGEGWSILAQAVWTKKCSDLLCTQNVAKLAQQMSIDAVELQKQRPDDSSLAVQGEINRAYGKKFQAEIDASTARALAAAVKKMPPLKPVKPQPIVLRPKP